LQVVIEDVRNSIVWNYLVRQHGIWLRVFQRNEEKIPKLDKSYGKLKIKGRMHNCGGIQNSMNIGNLWEIR
jgi:hypothetical protein